MQFGFVIYSTSGMSAFSSERNAKHANSEACFSEGRSERSLKQFCVNCGTIFGGFEDPKWQKMRSRNEVKKRSQKVMRGCTSNPGPADKWGEVPLQ